MPMRTAAPERRRNVGSHRFTSIKLKIGSCLADAPEILYPAGTLIVGCTFKFRRGFGVEFIEFAWVALSLYKGDGGWGAFGALRLARARDVLSALERSAWSFCSRKGSS